MKINGFFNAIGKLMTIDKLRETFFLLIIKFITEIILLSINKRLQLVAGGYKNMFFVSEKLILIN